MKRIITIFTLLFAVHAAYAQNWQAVGPDDSLQASFNGVTYASVKMAPSGEIYAAYQDQGIYLSKKITVRKYSGGKWQTVGNANFSAGATNYDVIAISNTGTPYVAYQDVATSNKLTVQKFDGTSWSVVGTAGISGASATYESIAISSTGTPYVAYVDGSNGNKATVQKFDGTSWSVVGTAGFTLGNTTYITLMLDGNNVPYISCLDAGSGLAKSSMLKFDGTSWVQVGGTYISTVTATIPVMAFGPGNTPYIAYGEGGATNGAALVKKFDGTNWVSVGTGAVSTGSVSPSLAMTIAANGMPYIGYYESIFTPTPAQYGTTIKKFDGANWVTVGAPINYSGFSTTMTWAGMFTDASNNPYFTIVDKDDAANVNIWKFDGTAWTNLVSRGITGKSSTPATSPSLTIDPSGTPYMASADSGQFLVVRKYNGTNWVQVGGYAAATKVDYLSITTDKNGTPYVSYYDQGNRLSIGAAKFDGTNWVPLDTAVSLQYAYNLASIAVDKSGTPYVGLVNYNSFSDQPVVVNKFDGTHWNQVGPNISTNGGKFPSIAFSHKDTMYIAYQETGASSTYLVQVKKYNGTGWVSVGAPDISTKQGDYVKLVFDRMDTAYIAYQEKNAVNKFTTKVKKFDGTNWIDITGNGFPGGNAPNSFANTVGLAIDVNNTPYVSYTDSFSSNAITVKKYVQGNWVQLGTTSASSAAAVASSLAVHKQNLFLSYRFFNSGNSAGPVFAKKFIIPYCDTVTNFTVNGTVSSATLQWNTLGGTLGYEYAVTQSPIPPASGTSTTGNSVTVNSLTPSSLYYAHLRTDCSVSSTSIWLTRPFTTYTCDTVANLGVSNVTVSSGVAKWNKFLGATAGYEYIVDQSAATPSGAGTTTIDTTYTATGLMANTTYYVHVRSSCGGSSRSAWIARPFTTLGCDTSMNISISGIGFDSAVIAWSKIPNVVGYKYVVDQSANTPASGTATTDTTYTAKALTANTTYYVHVQTNCDANNSSAWITRSFTTLGCDTPKNLMVTNITSNSAGMSWDTVANAIGYEAFMSQTSTPPASGVATTGHTFTANGMLPNTTYHYHLRTSCGSNTFSPWIEAVFTTKPLGIQSYNADRFAVTVYPNPVTDVMSVNITGGSENALLQLMDVNGRIVKEIRITTSGTAHIPVTGLAQGTYWLKYIDDAHSGIMIVQRL